MRMRDISVTSMASSGPDDASLWRQIADTLRGEIAGGHPAPGERLPAEGALAARFGVNRHTVRRAAEWLAREGLVRIEQGRGTFVADEVLDYVVGPRTRFTEWIERHKQQPAGRVLQLREMEAAPAVAAALGLRRGASVVLLERLGSADGRPVSLGRHHFPAGRLPGIAAALRETDTITEALRRVGVPDYLRRVTRVSARMPSAAEARLLRMPCSRPVLESEGLNADLAGRLIEYGLALYPTPRVQIVFEPGGG